MPYSTAVCTTKAERLRTVCLFALLSAGFVILSSDTTSPLYATDPFRIINADPSTFQVIGRYWLTEGLLPYVGLFDQKGPMIFLVNGLGWLLTGNVHGICVFQALSLFLFLSISYQTLRLRHAARISFWAAVLAFFQLSLIYGIGDTVEEFNLPVMALCLQGFYRYVLACGEGRGAAAVPHEPRWALVYGMGIGFFLMSRASDAGPVALGVLALSVWLLVGGKIANLLKNLLFGLAGLALVLLPVFGYFALHHAAGELWFGAIGFNLSYASTDVAFWLGELNRNSAVKLLIYALPIFSLMAAGALALLRREWLRAALWLSMSAYALAFFAVSRGYIHYLITFVPYTAVALPEMARLPGGKGRSWMKAAFAALLTGVVLLGGVQGRNYFREDFAWREQPEPRELTLLEQIPAEERGSVVFYNCLSSLYLEADIRPCCRYFVFQDWQAYMSPEMMQRIMGEYARCEAAWILVMEPMSENIRAILEANYESVGETDIFILYRRSA